MENGTGFFDESPNNRSIGRLIIFILSMVGILFSGAVMVAGLYKYLQCDSKESLAIITASSTSMLVSVTATAMTFKTLSKSQENKP